MRVLITGIKKIFSHKLQLHMLIKIGFPFTGN